MADIDINSVLSQMRALAERAQFSPPAEATAQPAVEFSELLKNSINQVNEVMTNSAQLSESFARGDANADLGQVMVALQKANVSFQAMTQVRNQLVSAYKDIMNMAI